MNQKERLVYILSAIAIILCNIIMIIVICNLFSPNIVNILPSESIGDMIGETVLADIIFNIVSGIYLLILNGNIVL